MPSQHLNNRNFENYEFDRPHLPAFLQRAVRKTRGLCQSLTDSQPLESNQQELETHWAVSGLKSANTDV